MRYHFWYEVGGKRASDQGQISAARDSDFYRALPHWLERRQATLCPGTIVCCDIRVLPDPLPIDMSLPLETQRAIEELERAILFSQDRFRSKLFAQT